MKFLYFIVTTAALIIAFKYICDVVKTHIECKYKYKAEELEEKRRKDSLASYMFRKDDP